MIEFQNLRKKFKNTEVLKDISFSVKAGETVALIGPSGCGKTTTLRMVNRLLQPTSGNILINGKSIYDMDVIKLRRSIGYVIQHTGLFPHMTIEENIELIPKVEKYPEEKRKNRTYELMDMIGMGKEYLPRYPNELSGGQQQRIGVARAFATDPEIILMDEPFSALDPISRTQLQDELLHLQSDLKKTILFVTHDMDEAIKLADRICIMNDGEIAQFDEPEEILKNPCGEFVESFVGKNRIWQSPELIRAEDIMIEHPVVCAPNIALTKALDKMRSRKVDSLMVTNRDGKMVGIINAETILAAHPLSQLVENHMLSQFTSCKPQDSIVDVLTTINRRNFSTMPVIDEQGILRGLITKSSLVTSLSQPILELSNNGEEVAGL